MLQYDVIVNKTSGMSNAEETWVLPFLLHDLRMLYMVSVTVWRGVASFIWTIENNVTELFLSGIESRTFFISKKVSTSNPW